MNRCYTSLLVVIRLISLHVCCQSRGFDDYNPQIYPDSLVDFGQCRLTEPSLVCDPNHLLNEQHGVDGNITQCPCFYDIPGILLLHTATQNVLFNTQCVCNTSCVLKTRGYTISIAVLNDIRGSGNKK